MESILGLGMTDSSLLSVRDAAEILGVNRQRVQALINEGRLPAQKIGSSYVIRRSDLKLVAVRKVGRPKSSAK